MKQYLKLIEKIKNKGTLKLAAREGMPNTQSLFGYQFRHDLSEGFPLLTTKKINFKHIVVELLWFLRGNTNIKYLIDNGCNIWNEDAYNYYKKVTSNINLEDEVLDILIEDISESRMRLFTYKEFVEYIKYSASLPNCREYTLGDCGIQYGKLWRNLKGVDGKGDITSTDQIKDLIEGLKKSPLSRRHIIDAWNPSTLNDMALNACHCLVQFNCRPLTFWERVNLMYKPNAISTSGDLSLVEEELNEANIPKYFLDCQMYQRSADVFLGVPYNIASYALLIHIIAKITNMVPGEYIHTFGDVHIYDNHETAIEIQLKREPSSLPNLLMKDEFHYITDKDLCGDVDLNTIINEMSIDWFTLKNYNPQSRIKAKLSTGLKK